MTATALQEAGALLEPLGSSIALLDKEGSIIYTNRAWNQFALENGGGDALGSNYLEACTDEVRAGVQSVLSGECPRWEHAYPCHSPYERRFFKMEVSRLHFGGQELVMVAHQNITEQRMAELQARSLQAALIVQSELLARYSFDSAHTLQEPLRRLTTTSSGLQTLAEGSRGEEVELFRRLRKYAEINQRAAQQISALLGSLGQYAQVGTGSDGVPGRFDLQAAFIKEAQQQDLKLELGELPPVTLSAGQGQQLVRNLLLNFRDLSGPGEVLDIRGNVEGDTLNLHLRLRPLNEQQAQEVLQPVGPEGKPGLEMANILTRHNGGRLWLERDAAHSALHVTLPLWI